MALPLKNRPDWRWAFASGLQQEDRPRAAARLRAAADPLCSRIYDFCRAQMIGAEDSDEELYRAYSLYIAPERAKERQLIDGYLLAGASDVELSEATEDFSVEAVKVYHDCFFAVRPALRKPIWILANVFQGAVHRNAHANDEYGTLLRIAWIGGKEVYERFLHRGLGHADGQKLLLDMIKEVVHRQAVDVAFALPHRENAGDLIRALVGLSDAKTNEKIATQNEELSAALDSFFDGLSVSVAKPSDAPKLLDGGRELRECQYAEVLS